VNWPEAGARRPTPVANTPTTVGRPDGETSGIEQAPPVGQLETTPTPVVPVAPERRPAQVARTEGDRGRELEAARRADEQRRQAEIEAARRGEEQRRQTEVEASRRAEEEQRRQGEVEAARRADEEQRRQTEAEATRRAEEVAAARRQAEAEAARARAQTAPPVQVARPLPVLSAPELARIRAQAEQKLTARGLLRMSGSDRWGVMVEVGSTGEIALSGTLRDISLYQEAIRLVRGIPGVQDVKATGVSVSELGTVSPAQSDAAGIRTEIQARLRSRGLLREGPTDRWGVTVEVGAGGDVTLGGVVRDAGLQGEAIRLVQGVPGVQNVKQDIRVMEGAGRQGTSSSP
jgi:osmotically-inducible protein OsmY